MDILKGTAGRRRVSRTAQEPPWVRRTLIGLMLLWLALFLFLPIMVVLSAAFEKGLAFYVHSITSPETLAAIRLTLLTVMIVIPMNLVFGLCAAWSIAKFDFPGKKVLLTLLDLPFTVSPVISGLIFILLFGASGLLGPWLNAHNIRIVFAVPAIILVTAFVTVPFIAKELIPLMQSLGNEEEISALTLGANGWQTFWRVTLPNVKWGVLYGVILCNARAMGEFGAVSVVSGHIRGVTNTVPLHIEILYNEYNYVAAFAVASLLMVVALITLGIKKCIEWGGVRSEASSVVMDAGGINDGH